MDNYWSRIPGFYSYSPQRRRELLQSLPLGLADADWQSLDQGLALASSDLMSENVIGNFSLPFAVAPNFVVDREPVMVPMVTEEPSVVAAVAKMAKLVAATGGFFSSIEEQVQKGQVQLYGLADIDRAQASLALHKSELMAWLNRCCPSMLSRGGGVVDIQWRALASPSIGPMLIVEPLIDVRDAMGANMVNSLMESLKPKLLALLGGHVGLCILSNLCDARLARARCSLPFHSLSSDSTHDLGEALAQRMMAAHALAEVDIYRACTHNKGILNGIDAVAIASGNDFRAIEAGAHAFAALKGAYGPLTRMKLNVSEQSLEAELCLPLAVGVVGGGLTINKGVVVAHKILGSFAQSNKKLAAVMVSVGLAQCLAALLALCSEGIQKGHMALHHKKISGPEIDHAN